MSNEQNKLVTTVTDSTVIVSITNGVGYLVKKLLREDFLEDPSSRVMNFVKFTGIVAGSMVLKGYLEKEKILPKSV